MLNNALAGHLRFLRSEILQCRNQRHLADAEGRCPMEESAREDQPPVPGSKKRLRDKVDFRLVLSTSTQIFFSQP